MRYAKLIEEAGADALELNLYCVAADPAATGSRRRSEPTQHRQQCGRESRIPLAVKLAPYYSSFANFAAKMTKAGVAGLVLMNRFYQPDFDPIARGRAQHRAQSTLGVASATEMGGHPSRAAAARHLPRHHNRHARRGRRGQGLAWSGPTWR